MMNKGSRSGGRRGAEGVNNDVEQISNYHEWDEDRLGLFFRKRGLGGYCAVLKTHKITGALAPLLQDSDLKELGIDIVGDRLMFKHHLKELSRRERFNKRIETHWEGIEQVFFNEREQAILVRLKLRNTILQKGYLPTIEKTESLRLKVSFFSLFSNNIK